jgi:hypothetical protein
MLREVYGRPQPHLPKAENDRADMHYHRWNHGATRVLV